MTYLRWALSAMWRPRWQCIRLGHSLACMWDGGHVCIRCKQRWASP